jgi:17beta-estradiol 17-dehydrogenase / very-long-chain 3-oxoacyl-CoA reductase
VQAQGIAVDFLRPEDEIYPFIESELQKNVGLDNISVLVNNVGGSGGGTVFGTGIWLDRGLKEEEATRRFNLVPTLRMTRMLLPSMRKKKKGIIINVSSLSSLMSGTMLANYTSDKVHIYRLILTFSRQRSINSLEN